MHPLRGPAGARPAPRRCCRGCSRRGGWPRSSRRCASSAPRSLDPLVGAGGFDFIADLGAQMPMRTIGMLLGIPEEDQEAIRDRIDDGLRLDEGAPPRRRRRVERRQRRGVRRLHRLAGRAPVRRPHDRAAQRRVRGRDRRRAARSTRDEILGYVGLLAGAGNETTTRLIGWTGKVLAEHPDQRARARRRPRRWSRTRSRSCCATRRRHRCRPATSRATSSTTARRSPAGSVMLLLTGVGQPRRAPLPRRRPLRHPPQDRPPPLVRLRHPLLPRRRAGPPRRPRRARRGAASASPSGRSTGTTPSRPTPRTVRGWEKLPVLIG